MREQLALALLTIPDVLGRIDKTRGVALLFAAVFLAGVGSMATMGEFAGHEARIHGLESWVVTHEDSVTAPRLRQIDALDATQRQNVGRLMRIETLLSCIYYEIERCPDPAPNPPPTGR